MSINLRKSKKRKRGTTSFGTPRLSRSTRSSWWDDVDAGCCVAGAVFDGPGDCFVATAAHGDDVAAPQVQILRAYRDQRLARHQPGRAFTKAYYRYGRYGARLIRRYPASKPLVRALLSPAVRYAQTKVN